MKDITYTVVTREGEKYAISAPDYNPYIGNPALIGVASFLLQNGTAIANIVLGQTISNAKLQGKKVYAITEKVTLAQTASSGEYPIGKGNVFGRATGRVWKTSEWLSSGQTYIEVELSKTYGSDWNDNLWEVKIGQKVWAEVHDVQVEASQVTPTDDASKPLKLNQSGTKYLSLLTAILIEKGYATSSYTAQEWRADYTAGKSYTYTSNSSLYRGLANAGLPTEFSTIQQALNSVNSLPQKGGINPPPPPVDPNPDPEPDPEEKQGVNPMWYAVGFAAAAKFGLLGKKLQKALKFG